MNPNHLLGWSAVGLIWWACVFTYGFFQTIMWTVILTACVGIYLNLKDGFN